MVSMVKELLSEGVEEAVDEKRGGVKVSRDLFLPGRITREGIKSDQRAAVRERVNGRAIGNRGGNVGGVALHFPGNFGFTHFFSFLDNFAHSEVANFDFSFRIKKNIIQLDVSV